MTLAIQIVPTLPPPDEGVGSFATALAEALRSHSVESRFLVADRSRTAEALQAALEADGAAPVLLHYAGYGYHPRGCPAWLAEGLRLWKQGGPRRLVTVFHEVYATGRPWQSSFWLSPAQRRIASRIARMSDGIVTSLDLYGRLLQPLAPGRRIEVLPVFSTVGELAEVPPLAGRERRIVLFGGPGARQRALTRLAGSLATACRALGAEEVCDVGSGEASAVARPDRVGDVPVRRLGRLPAEEVSALLQRSLAGFVAYPPPLLAKSTIFAAYCAHGVLPVCDWDRPRRETGPPPPFWRPSPVAPSPDEIQGIAGRARAWYAGHTLERHAALYHEILTCVS
ncbi:MAG TPA: glycosyltransferase family 1 protein [Thermoanaerobaculia bacterium]